MEGPAVPELGKLEVQRSDEMSERTSLPVSGQWGPGWGRAASAERLLSSLEFQCRSSHSFNNSKSARRGVGA